MDGCVLQDTEIVFNNLWENFEDAFVKWVPLIEDKDEEAALIDLPIETVERQSTSNVYFQGKNRWNPLML